MYGTIERVQKVKQRVGQLQNKQEKRVIDSLFSLSIMLSAFLLASIGCLAKQGLSSVPGFYGAMLMYEDAGSHVLVAVVSFITAVIITAVCLRYRYNKAKKTHKGE